MDIDFENESVPSKLRKWDVCRRTFCVVVGGTIIWFLGTETGGHIADGDDDLFSTNWLSMLSASRDH